LGLLNFSPFYRQDPMTSISVAVVGATGAVGREMIATLHQRNFPIQSLTLFASSRSAGMQLDTPFGVRTVQPVSPGCFCGIDLVLMSAGGEVSKTVAPQAVAEGAVVIDNSSRWRMDAAVPLVVPEVNPQTAFTHQGIIANPNCSTIQMVVALHPIHQRWGIKRIIVSTYQAVSGSGRTGINELKRQISMYPDADLYDTTLYGKPIMANVLPRIGAFRPDGFTDEERKMIDETRKILDDQSLAISATTVRVPVIMGHSESVTLELARHADPEEVRQLLAVQPGMQVMDDPVTENYPTPLLTTETDDVLVGRIRRDAVFKHGLSLWVVANNLRKGAALNAVQIAEVLYGR
jgi:aspartate-semialdehyde dehydrogenase